MVLGVVACSGERLLPFGGHLRSTPTVAIEPAATQQIRQTSVKQAGCGLAITG